MTERVLAVGASNDRIAATAPDGACAQHGATHAASWPLRSRSAIHIQERPHDPARVLLANGGASRLMGDVDRSRESAGAATLAPVELLGATTR